MERDVLSSIPEVGRKENVLHKNSLRVKKKTLQAVLEECQRALQLMNQDEVAQDGDDSGGNDGDRVGDGGESLEEEHCRKDSSLADQGYCEADELYNLIRSRMGSHDFVKKIESAQENVSDGSSWDVVSKDDLWGEKSTEPEEDYVLVGQEDILDGIACFMATYLSSLNQTKDLTPDQLQKALSRTFSVKKRKGKLRKAWDGGKVIYNVASWSATVIGIYQNPVILTVASKAFWASCHVISKLV